ILITASLLLFVVPIAATQVSSNLEGKQMSLTRQAGLSAVITCDIEHTSKYIHWYQYQEGMAPRRLLYYQVFSSNVVVESGITSGKYHAYGGTGRTCKFSLENLEEDTDSGVYYCAVWERHSDSDLPYPALKILLVAAKSSLDTQDRPAPAFFPALTSLCSEQRETLSSVPHPTHLISSWSCHLPHEP
uniref:Ig-like domain-containing protein n=1 Tax=Equus caballus TaxID=9796 RepID=A0A5F5PWN8_HORSE